jgi:hypothetical protein
MSTAMAASPWGITATNATGGGPKELPPAGNNPGVLVGLIDLGSHQQQGDKGTYVARQALLCWELTAEHKSDGSPFIVIKDYNIKEKLGKKSALREMLESWRNRPLNDGEAIDLMALLSKPCLVGIAHGKAANGNDYAKVTGIGSVPRGMPVPRALTVPFEWHFGAGEFVAPDWLPFLYGEPVEDVIKRSIEAGGSTSGSARIGPGPAVPLVPAAGVPVAGVPVGAGVGADDEDAPPF